MNPLSLEQLGAKVNNKSPKKELAFRGIVGGRFGIVENAVYNSAQWVTLHNMNLQKRQEATNDLGHISSQDLQDSSDVGTTRRIFDTDFTPYLDHVKLTNKHFVLAPQLGHVDPILTSTANDSGSFLEAPVLPLGVNILDEARLAVANARGEN